MHVLVTGTAGFIGFHLSKRLIAEGHTVVGIDNLNDYYSVQLKKDRLAQLQAPARLHLRTYGPRRRRRAGSRIRPQHVLACREPRGTGGRALQPRQSQSYVQSNLVGFGNLLECCRHGKVEHLVFASSSSVYGMNTSMPFSVHDNVDHPVSLYAASKKANELMAHTYSHLYRLPATGLRFFTVYGPWGRPDMALYLFTKAILAGEPIKVFNEGKMRRDFTYIDDIIEGVMRVMARIPQPDPAWDSAKPNPSTSTAPWRIYNIGNNNTVELGTFISTLEDALGKKAIRNLMPMQPGDVEATWADVSDLIADTGFRPQTSVEYGVGQFVKWYKEYYGA